MCGKHVSVCAKICVEGWLKHNEKGIAFFLLLQTPKWREELSVMVRSSVALMTWGGSLTGEERRQGEAKKETPVP